VFDYLGMETALKSREYKQGETLEVGTYNPGTGAYEGDSLHWRITSGSHSTEITILPGEYTLAQLAERLQNAASGWLEVNLDVTDAFGVAGPDDKESGVGTSANAEAATSRLVIRSTDGSPVTFMDMNKQRYAEEIGLSTALRADKDTTGVKTIVLPSAPCLDGNLAAAVRVQMTCGKTYDIRLARKDIMNADGTAVDRVKVMEQIAKQVNAQEGSEVLKVVLPVDEYGKAEDGYASLVAVTGEPFEVVDLPILDPNWSASYTAGIAAQMGIHGGVTSNLELAHIKDDTKMGTDRTGTIRFESLGRSVEIDVTENDTVKTIMDRLRSQAGDWLYVNYFDENMGGSAGQEGDYPIVAVAAKDGSAVNIIDVKGTVAEKLMLSTGIQGTETVAVYANRELDITQGNGTWQIPAGGTPQTFNITVAGYTHTIDLTAMRDINGNNVMDIEDLVAEINSRMQDDDVKAELNDDGKLVLWSPRGYSIQIGGVEDATDISTKLTSGAGSFTPGAPGVSGNPGTPSSASVNAYRGGYGLDVSDAALREGYSKKSVYAQNVVTRSGANQTKQNFFGVLDDISAAVRAENRDGLSGKLLPQIEKAIDTLLRLTATSGALQSRYENNVSRMQMTGLSMTESHDELVGVELADISTELMMAQAIYQASLVVISYIIQPTLLDFLR
jgi:flagellar hook-associated protein 3 FlgL